MKVSVQATVKSEVDKVWSAWTSPADINQWKTAGCWRRAMPKM
jgi:uncharacterized protein YndB with AHSA1/START domain